jgi:hypothetical protein
MGFEELMGMAGRIYDHRQPETGMRKVNWLINQILKDKTISKDMKRRRIVYLIALNKKHRWAKTESVRKAVDRALAKLEGSNPNPRRKGRRRISKKAVLKALRSPKIPKRLKEGLRKWAKARGYI